MCIQQVCLLIFTKYIYIYIYIFFFKGIYNSIRVTNGLLLHPYIFQKRFPYTP